MPFSLKGLSNPSQVDPVKAMGASLKLISGVIRNSLMQELVPSSESECLHTECESIVTSSMNNTAHIVFANTITAVTSTTENTSVGRVIVVEKILTMIT